jgi:AcrR family transcriptional regulator
MTSADQIRRRDSTATRAAILAAARSHFADDGFDRATIRAIAATAGVDPAMVMRYYGNKAGLFAAASDYDLHLPDFTKVPVRQLGATLVRAFLDRWEPDGQVDGALLVLLGTALTEDSARDTMRTVFARQVQPVVVRAAPEGHAPVRAGLIASQVLGLALTRYVLRLPPVVGLTADEIAAWMGPVIQRYLTTPAPLAS